MNIRQIPLCSESTLTQRYQTTIPAPIRQALNLSKNDKIRYTIESDNKVTISRVVEEEESDPILGSFLNFLAKDMKENPEHIQAVSSEIVNRAKSLTEGVDIDLDAPLEDEKE